MTQMEALELALRLAIAAPDQKHADEVVQLAETISQGMTLEEIDAVKEEIEYKYFNRSEYYRQSISQIRRSNGKLEFKGRN